MSDIKLKPCPFCGNPVWFNYNFDLEPDGVKCQACGYLLGLSDDPHKTGKQGTT